LMLRPGNAGSNDADDHLELLDQAIGFLSPPLAVATGGCAPSPGLMLGGVARAPA
jgi:hypothetical protein